MKKTILTTCISLMALIAGCKTITYENVPQGKRVTYTTFGLSTSIGSVEIQTENGQRLLVTDSKSDAGEAIGLANKILDRVPVK